MIAVSPFHCSPEWHLARLKTAPLSASLYGFAFRLTEQGNAKFYASVQSLSEYFDVSRWKIHRAVKALLRVGFFKIVAREPFMPTTYQVFSHTDWATSHPESCTEREVFPWSAETGDELGVELWKLSGGKVKLRPMVLHKLRQAGLSDAALAEAFGIFFAAEERFRQTNNLHGQWNQVAMRFNLWITNRLKPQMLEAYGLQKFVKPHSATKTT